MFNSLIEPGFYKGWELKKEHSSLSEEELESQSFNFACEYGFDNLDMLSDDFEDHVLIVQKVYKDAYNLSDGMTRPGTSFMFDRAFSYYNNEFHPTVLVDRVTELIEEQQKDKSLYKVEIIKAYKAGWLTFYKINRRVSDDKLLELALEYSLYPNGKYKIAVRNKKRTRIALPPEDNLHKADFLESAFVAGFHARRLMFGLKPRQEKMVSNQLAQKYYSSL